MSGLAKIARWRNLILCLALLGLWVARPIGVDAPRAIDTEFDTARAMARLKVVLGDERPHPSGSDANDAVVERLLAQIRGLGFTPIERETFHCNDLRKGAAICAQPRNIAFWVTAPGDNAVMLNAHHDSVAAGPGAADDGMGVAVALEVAHLLKGRALKRPLLVVITDAEEAGLVGAAAFAAGDPLAKRVGAVINLEARGTTGGVNMFQTSTPNAHDIAAIAQGGYVPSANALATNLYELLPNDSDLTMLLPLGVDAANYALIGSGKRYHTPRDDLAHLDPASVRHLGVSALSAVQGFAAAAPQGSEGSEIFTNLGRWILLVLPVGGAALSLALGLAGAITVFARSDAGRPWRTLLGPPLAVVAGTIGAVAVGMLIAALRAEQDFGTAYPAAPRLAYGAAALLGASLAVWSLRIPSGQRLAAAAWIWLTLLVAAAFAVVPGLATLIAWSMPFLLLAGLATLRPAWRSVTPVLLGIAAALFILVTLPAAGGLEDALFVEHAAAFAMLLVWMFLFCMPGVDRHFRFAPIACALLLAGATVTALMVPAFTRDAPRHLSVVHQDADGKGAFLLYDNGRLPDAMQAVARFDGTPDKDGRWRAKAPALADDGRLTLLSGDAGGGLQTVRLIMQSPSADRQELLVEKGEGIIGIAVNGARQAVRGPTSYIGCSGRACRRLDVILLLDGKKPRPTLKWRRTLYGAGPAAARLVAARPDSAVPVHSGDTRELVRTVRLNR